MSDPEDGRGDRDRPSPAVVNVGERALAEDEDLPVVARMVVEIRSDGSRTVARGAVEDLLNDERVALRAEAPSALSLAGNLARAILDTRSLVRGINRPAAALPESDVSTARRLGPGRRLARRLARRVLGEED